MIKEATTFGKSTTAIDDSFLDERIMFTDISELLPLFCSAQQDLNELNPKGALFTAQTLDIKPIVGQSAIDRCKTPVTPEDLELQQLMKPAATWYTYFRLAQNYHTNYTDGGAEVEALALSKDDAKQIALDANDVARRFLTEVETFLSNESGTQPTEVPNLRTRVVKRV